MGQNESSRTERQVSAGEALHPDSHPNVTNKPPMPGAEWVVYKDLKDCLVALGPKAYGPPGGGLYCNGTWDKVHCWAALPANTTARMACPPMKGLDPTQFGYKTCGADGRWIGREPGSDVPWTDYTGCYTAGSKDIYERIFKIDPEVIREIAFGTIILEMVGLCLSLVFLSISLFIFWNFRALRCDRTRIHRNLFLAIMIHVAIVLLVHVDKMIARSSGESVAGVPITNGSIDNTKVLCEILYTLMEYTKTVMFMWMFLEGFYLHNMLVVSVFSSGKPKYWLYYVCGWGIPALLTCVWAITTGLLDSENCWFGYTFRKYFWILEAPRAAVMSVNFIFLLNIIRVLVTKLRESNSTEAVQVRKAVKAAIVLLPLLGANNFLVFVDPPMDSAVKFGIWSYTSHFLVSFQGFFISLLYCFLNGEVQHTIRTHWERYWQNRGGYTLGRRRVSRAMSMFTTVSEVPCQNQPIVLSNLNGHTYVDKTLNHGDDNDNCLV